jgi:hypothetical protein
MASPACGLSGSSSVPQQFQNYQRRFLFGSFEITSEGFYLASKCFSSVFFIAESPKIVSMVLPNMLLTLCQCESPDGFGSTFSIR